MPEDRLEASLRRIEQLVGEMLGGAERKKEALSAIFELDDEIGKRARASRDSKEELIPFQQWINALTVAVKNSDAMAMADSVTHARRALKVFLDGMRDCARRA